MNEEREIIDAIKGGNADRVRELIEQDIFLADARDENGTSALLTAYYSGQPEIAQIILDSAPTLSIHEAAAAGEVDRIEELLAHDPSLIGAFSNDGWTPLHLAAFFDRERVARLLLDRGAPLDAVSTNPTGVTPLHSALANRNNKIAALLIRAGADIRCAEESGGYTPLHYAAANDLEYIAQILLELGADPTATTRDGRDPLSIARERGSERVIALLEGETGGGSTG